uniref:uncharacterized protein LOC122591570 n=1 Tax=Erigeron canadensis TaxID=72917 RepID=UPI001CB8B859|nr:uncharacterized protein LOC122591570 [Erigeron canadensis]
MAAREALAFGSDGRPPVLFRGSYPLWKKRFLNWIDRQKNAKNIRMSLKEGPEIPKNPVNNEPLLEESWNAEQKNRVEADQMSIAYLYQALPDDIFCNVDSYETGKEIWDEKSFKGSRKCRIELETDSEVSDVSDPELDEKDLEMYKELAYFTKAFKKKFFKKKPTNNQLRSSSVSSYVKHLSAPKFETFKEPVAEKMYDNDKRFERKVLEKKNGERKCYNCGILGHIATECTKPRKKNYEYYKYKLMLAKQEESGIPLLAEDDKWLHLTDDETDELAANVCFMTKIKKSKELNDEAADSTEGDDEVITIPKKLLEFDNLKSEKAAVTFTPNSKLHLEKQELETKVLELTKLMTQLEVEKTNEMLRANGLAEDIEPYISQSVLEKEIDDLKKSLNEKHALIESLKTQNHCDNKRNPSKSNTSICDQPGCSVCEIMNETEQNNSENTKTSNQSTCSICEILNASVQTDLEVVNVSVQINGAQNECDAVSVDPNDIYFDTSIPKFSEDTQTYFNEFNDVIKKFENEKDKRIKSG